MPWGKKGQFREKTADLLREAKGRGKYFLGQEVADDFAVDVGEAIVAAAVAVSEAGVIHAEEMEDGGVEVVHVNAIFGDGRADFVGAAVGEAAFNARAGEPR